jgi:hypothetical protein
MPHPREMPQSTDRIIRIAGNVVVCRAFLRSVSVMLYRPLSDRYRPPRQIPPADRPLRNELFCGAFSSPLVIAVVAVGILAALPMAYNRSACILLPGQHRCTRQATTSTPTRTPEAVLRAVAYGSTSPRTFSTLPWLSARSYLTTLAARSPTQLR